MALGVGTTLAVWWPMLLLIRRSTRVLHLAGPDNDIAMQYRRLASLILPGLNGWPEVMGFNHQKVFEGYPNDAYFWDTFCYMGLLPVAAVLALLVLYVVKRQMPGMPWVFLAAVGGGALLFSLPLTEPLRGLVPGTLFRSPARLLYLSTFAAAVALGYAVNAVLCSNLLRPRARQCMVGLCLLLHAVDLGGTSREFVHVVHWPAFGTAAFDKILDRDLKDGRIAADDMLADHDDAGFFDSIMLAGPYRAILGKAGYPADYNTQLLDGSTLAVPSLETAGVRFVVTETERPDLELVTQSGDDYLYRVAHPVPRAAFFARGMTWYVPADKVLDTFLSLSRRDTLLLPEESRTDSSAAALAGVQTQAAVEYARPSGDEIRLKVAAGGAGFVHVLESYDPGWSAEVDGKRSSVTMANGFSMAVPVGAGTHQIRLRYQTPGRTVGWALSLLCVSLLAALIWNARAIT
jgi:hypothetical protein